MKAPPVRHKKTSPPAKPTPTLRKTLAASVVLACIHGPQTPATASLLAPARLIPALKTGLPIRELDHLQSHLDLPLDQLVPLLGISKATLHRRKNSGHLDTGESDRVIRVAKLLGRAAVVMETLAAGRHWLTAPQHGLGGAVPLAYADTEVGAREVENLLGRIERGVYS